MLCTDIYITNMTYFVMAISNYVMYVHTDTQHCKLIEIYGELGNTFCFDM